MLTKSKNIVVSFVIFSFFIGGMIAQPRLAHAAAPTGFTSAIYADNNGDGTIDRLIVVINGGEALTSCVVTAGELSSDWTYTGNAFSGSIASASCDTATSTITFVLSGATAFTTGTLTAPTIAYNNNDGDNSIANGSGNLGNVSAVTAADGAAPVPLSSLWALYDQNGNGTVDQIFANFSESVNCSFESADWSVPSAGTFNMTSPTNCSSFSNSVVLTVSGDAGITGGTMPQLKYTNQGTLGSVQDYSGNAAATTGNITLFDAAPPQIKSFSYYDTDLDGKIDRLVLAYTETVTANSVLRQADLAFTNPGDFTGAAFSSDTTDLITSSVSSTTIDLGTEATAVDTLNNNGSISISSQNSFSLRDAAFANNNVIKAQSQAAYIDAAAPVIKTFTYLDQDGDGKIDAITVTFSETVASATTFSANNLSFNNVGSFTGAAFGSNNTDLVTGSVSSVVVPLGTEATAVATRDNAATLSISSQNSLLLSDGTNSHSTVGAQLQAVYADGAAPVLTELTPVVALASDPTPDYVFNSTEAGAITYGGSCSSSTNMATNGSNPITFATLPAGTYTNCMVRVTDSSANASTQLAVTGFTIDLASPVISNVSAVVSQNSVSISWLTDEQSSSIVDYGLTAAYGSTTSEADTAPRVTSHNITIGGFNSCFTYHFRVRSKDALLFESIGNDGVFTIATCGGGGSGGSGPLLSSGSNQTQPPVGQFKVLMPEGQSKILSPALNLSFAVGPDVQKVALSNNPQFTDSIIESFATVKPWNICWRSSLLQTLSPCPAGIYKIYAKFYNSSGQASEVVSATVTYEPLGLNNTPDSSKLSSNDLVLDGKTIYLLMQNKKHGFSSLTVFKALGYSLKNLKKASTAYIAEGKIIASKTSGHIIGSWVIKNKTIYYVAADGLIPVPSWDRFLSNGGKPEYIILANKSDLAKPKLKVLELNDQRVSQ